MDWLSFAIGVLIGAAAMAGLAYVWAARRPIPLHRDLVRAPGQPIDVLPE